MTNTTETVPAPQPQNDAALLGVVELLLNPEFGRTFIVELIQSTGATPTEERITETTDALMKKNRELAAPIIEMLPYELGKSYR